MSLPCRIRLAASIVLLALGACRNGNHQPQDFGPAGGGSLVDVPVSGLIPAAGALPDRPDPRATPYYDNSEAVVTGMRLFKQMNCAGCHFNGGGGIGPPLMDDKWMYGGRLDQIYDTIRQGRPNGMPAWGGKLTDQQMWQIASYVRSMSLPETLAANQGGTPSQHPAPVPAEADRHGGWRIPHHEDQAGKEKGA